MVIFIAARLDGMQNKLKRFGSHCRSWLQARKTLLIGIAICTALLILFRGHWLLSNGVVNPDEAEILAAGKLAHLNLIPYRSYTTSTYLFLWPMFLGFLGYLGIPLTLPTAHILGGLAYEFIIVTGWYLTSLEYGWKFSSIFVLPTALFLFSGGNTIDFLSLGTELLPIAILFVALWILFSSRDQLKTNRYSLGSAIAGFSIWAKPQMLPLALSLVGSCFILRMLENCSNDFENVPRSLNIKKMYRDAFIGLSSFIAPSVLLIVFLAIVGELHNFQTQGISELFGYLNHSNTAAPSLLTRAQNVNVYLWGYPIAFVWAIGGLMGWTNRETLKWPLVTILRTVAWALPLVAAVFTFMTLSNLLGHYLNLLFAASMISAIIGSRISGLFRIEIQSVPSGRNMLAHISAIAFIVVLLANVSILWTNVKFVGAEVRVIATKRSLPPVDAFNPGASKLPKLCPAGSRVYVWGWANELYSYYNWIPASENLNSGWSLDSPSTVLANGTSLVSEFETNPPQCIVQAIGPYFFGGMPLTDTIRAAVPDMAQLLKSCYRRHITTVGFIQTGYEHGQRLNFYVLDKTCRLVKS